MTGTAFIKMHGLGNDFVILDGRQTAIRLSEDAVRAIADPAARAIPPWLLKCVAEDGGLRPAAVIAPLLARPWKVWALIGLARENGKALGSLRRVASLGGPRLGFG